MDPFTALGLAAAVVQFVDFGIEIFHKSNEILTSATGGSVDNTSIIDTTRDLQFLLEKIKESQPKIPRSTILPPDQASLNDLVDNCNDIGDDLLKLARKGAIGPGAGRRKSLAAALSTVWSAKQIKEKSDRLEKYQKQLNTNIMVSLR